MIDELIKAWEDAIRNDQKAEIEECKPSTCLDQLDHRNESMVNVQPSTVEVNHSLIFKELQMRWNNNEKKAPKQEVKKSNDESVQDHESEELVVDVPKITIISPTPLSSIADMEELALFHQVDQLNHQVDDVTTDQLMTNPYNHPPILEPDQVLTPSKMTMIKYLPNLDQHSDLELDETMDQNRFEDNVEASEEFLGDLAIPDELINFEGLANLEVAFESQIAENELEEIEDDLEEPLELTKISSCNPCYSVADQRPSGGQIETLTQSYYRLIQKLDWLTLEFGRILQKVVRVVKHIGYGSLACAQILNRRRQDLMDQLSNDQYVENILKLGLTFTTGLSLCVILLVFFAANTCPSDLLMATEVLYLF